MSFFSQDACKVSGLLEKKALPLRKRVLRSLGNGLEGCSGPWQEEMMWPGGRTDPDIHNTFPLEVLMVSAVVWLA